MRILSFFLLIAFYAGAAWGASVDASLQPTSAHIGDTLALDIRVNGANNRPILFPVPSDSAFDILRMDTTQIGKGRITFTLAVYDTGEFALDEMPVVVGRDASAETLYTAPMSVHIRSILPDSASSIQPIKPYREHPFQLRELLGWSWIPGVLLLGFLGWWLYRKYARKKAGIGAAAIPLLPPHEEAVRNLISLRDRKYPARGMLKEFFTDFSVIMRRYLERRYEFPALEMTTYELELELEDKRFEREWTSRLIPILHEADLVKFAKHIPDSNRCDECITVGFELVERTKPRPEAEQAEEKAA
ncbi:hypothetical protein EHM69_05990 [candidate division KSB1 bacterium]|nr:MAG: hypothetical protein EHM69_05990 [candidate division KSB1 bacterium]